MVGRALQSWSALNLGLSGLFFDLDGVLVDTREAWFAVMNAAARALNCSPISRARFNVSWGQSIEADTEQFYAGHSVATLRAFFETHFRDHANLITVEPHAQEMIEKIYGHGMHWAVITNTPLELAEQILASSGLEPQLVFSPNQILRPKPASDLLYAACSTLSLSPAEVCFVGDTNNDCQAALAAGIDFVGYGDIGSLGGSRVSRLSELITMFGLDAPGCNLG